QCLTGLCRAAPCRTWGWNNRPPPALGSPELPGWGPGGAMGHDPSRADRHGRVVQRNPLPAVCDVSVTNVCNAACGFCGFSRDKKLAGPRRYLDLEAFTQALPILKRRHIRYMTFQGGEPLVHPKIMGLVSAATEAGMRCNVITNGWFLPTKIEAL